MTCKHWIFWGIICCLFLTGCTEQIEYNPDLFKPDQASCWPCQMYMSAFHAMVNVLESSLFTISSNALKILTIALVFWLLYKVFPWVVSLSPPNFKEDFVVVIKTLFKAMCVAIFLSHPDYFYTLLGGYILQPMGDLFLKVSEFVLLSPNSLGIETSQYARSQNTFLSGLMDWGRSVSDWTSSFLTDSGLSDVFAQIESAFSQSRTPNGQIIRLPASDRMFGALPMQIQNVIWQIYSALWSGMGLVFQLFQSDHFVAWLPAVALAVALFQLMVFLPLSFVDAFMRMGIGILLLPVFMVLWVLPIEMSKGVGKKALELILAAFFDILFNCIYVAFLISVLRVYVQEKLPNIFSTDYQASESSLRESGLQMGWEFIVMFVLVYTVFKLSNKVDDISGTFFDGAGKGTSVSATIEGIKNLAGTAVAAVGRACIGDFSGFKKLGSQTGQMLQQGMENMNAAQDDKDHWLN